MGPEEVRASHGGLPLPGQSVLFKFESFTVDSPEAKDIIYDHESMI